MKRKPKYEETDAEYWLRHMKIWMRLAIYTWVWMIGYLVGRYLLFPLL